LIQESTSFPGMFWLYSRGVACSAPYNCSSCLLWLPLISVTPFDSSDACSGTHLNRFMPSLTRSQWQQAGGISVVKMS
jgi:hypothetical protein